MKASTFALLLVFIIIKPCISQVNLIANPGFEIFSSCPSSPGQFELLNGWDTLRNGGGGLPLILTSCCSFSSACGIPSNIIGYQFPRTDSSYGSVGMYQNTAYVRREYIQNKLKQKLVSGQAYCLKFYVNLCNDSQYAIDQIGAYFDDGTISTPWAGVSTVTPQIVTSLGIFYNDTLKWVMISGTYTANGTEQYLTIGNFKTNSSTNAQNFNPSANRVIACYNIDDVSLIPADIVAFAHNDTTICFGDSLMLGRIPEVGLECSWFDTNGSVLGNKPNLWVKPGSTQTYIVRMDNCITSYDICIISVKPKIFNLAVSSSANMACPDSSVQLNASIGGSPGAIAWQWSPSVGLSNPNTAFTKATIQQDQLYFITVTAPPGFCPPNLLRDSILIKMTDCSKPVNIMAPNVFSPNGDGNNDSWVPEITNPSEINSWHCIIFDRWGVKLFESNKPLQSWDGRDLTGVRCIPGTYYFVIDTAFSGSAKFNDNKHLQGFIELIR
jgi:gliding motility-associated-like protein